MADLTPSRDHSEAGLRPQLSAGQMAMVAVGGSIGTGLLLGAGAAVHIAGPAVILSYLIAALLAWIVTNALGEMASVHPAAGSFGVYADIYLHPWAGFVVRYAYWSAVSIAVAAEMVAAATYMHFWFPRLPGALLVILFAAALLFLNLRAVGQYAEVEYWFAMVKVVTIVAFVVIGSSLLLGGRVAPQYLATGGFLPNGMGSPMLAVSFALFSFLGIEFVAISSGEARQPRDIPRATRMAFGLLAFVYVGASAVLVGVMPWNRAGVAQSPFVTVFQVVRLPAASALMNLVVLTAALSGANANLYAGARMLFSLARAGYAPRKAGELNASGSPAIALAASAGWIAIAVVMEYYAPETAFVYLIGASLFGGMLAWCMALAAHVRFRRTLSHSQVEALPMRAPGGGLLSCLGLAGIVACVASMWWAPQSRITVETGGPVLLLLTLGYVLVRKRRRITIES
jgi:amino acid transporter, AAT family